MAISKEHKQELLAQYKDWLAESDGLVITEYCGMTMPQISVLRNQLREHEGRYVIAKNTLFKLALAEAGYAAPDDLFTGPVAIGFSFGNLPGVTKTILDYTKDVDLLTVKGGIMQDAVLGTDDMKALADLPPMPIMQAMFLGTLIAPAQNLAALFNAGARQLVDVLKAKIDKESETESDAEPEAAAA